MQNRPRWKSAAAATAVDRKAGKKAADKQAADKKTADRHEQTKRPEWAWSAQSEHSTRQRLPCMPLTC